MCGACADPYLRATAPLPLALLAPDAVVARALGQFAARARSRHRPRQRSRIDRVHVGRFAVSCKAQIVYRLRATGDSLSTLTRLHHVAVHVRHAVKRRAVPAVVAKVMLALVLAHFGT